MGLTNKERAADFTQLCKIGRMVRIETSGRCDELRRGRFFGSII